MLSDRRGDWSWCLWYWLFCLVALWGQCFTGTFRAGLEVLIVTIILDLAIS
jgi:hypothetical protein